MSTMISWLCFNIIVELERVITAKGANNVDKRRVLVRVRGEIGLTVKQQCMAKIENKN